MSEVTKNEALFARWLVLTAMLFTLALCFVHTNIFPVSNALTAACEVAILTVAVVFVMRKSTDAVLLLVVVCAYLLVLAAMRFSIDLKTWRDIAIPILFYAIGKQYGSIESADRLVKLALGIVLGFALLEWLFLPFYVKVFDIQSFYISRGAIDATGPNADSGLFTSGLRFEGRTLLPFLGEHRVSSIFLEPISLGNFAAIAFIWTLYRKYNDPKVLLLTTIVILSLFVLGDARFGLYLSVGLFVVFFLAPLVRFGMLFSAPFLVMLTLVFFSMSHPNMPWDNTSVGRMLLGGQLLMQLDLAQVFGAGASGADFVDSGYAYLLSQLGLLGFAGLWAAYVYDIRVDGDEWNFKIAVGCYLVCLLAISSSLMTIKTAALLWFLVGAVARHAQARATAAAPEPSDQFLERRLAAR